MKLLLALLLCWPALAYGAEDAPPSQQNTVQETSGTELDEELAENHGLRYLADPQHRPSLDQEALRVLAFLMYGYDHRTQNPYRQQLATWLQRLHSAVDEQGSIEELDTIGHALVALALAEAHAMTLDAELVDPLNRLLAQVLSRGRRGGSEAQPWLAWGQNDYPPEIICTRSTWYACMALKAAMVGGVVDAAPALAAIGNWFELVYQLAGPDYFPATVDTVDRQPGLASAASANAMGAGLVIFSGSRPAHDPALVQLLDQETPLQLPEALADGEGVFATAHLYDFSGDQRHRQLWYDELLPAIAAAQAADGSWANPGDGPWSEPFSHSAWMLMLQGMRPFRWRIHPLRR